MKKFVCMICGYIYDEAAGIPASGIAPGTRWSDLPDDWVCPICGAAKSEFKEQTISAVVEQKETLTEENDQLRRLSIGELSSLCSNLARGCEKQYLTEESALFTQLSNYFKSKTPAVEQADHQALYELVQKDLNEGFIAANSVAGSNKDRGALRALVWSEKVSRILNSILSRYEKEGDAFLENANVYVCEICGFIYVGEEAPSLCPVCKVPNWKIAKVDRRG